jgi:hypothetical protein
MTAPLLHFSGDSLTSFEVLRLLCEPVLEDADLDARGMGSRCSCFELGG